MEKLDQMMFNKEFEPAHHYLTSSKSTINQEEEVFIIFIKQKLKLHLQISVNEKLNQSTLSKLFHQVENIQIPSSIQREATLQKLILKSFICQFVPKIPETYQKQLQDNLKQLPKFNQILQWKAYKNIDKYFYHGVSILQLYIQKMIIKEPNSQFNQQIGAMLQFHSVLTKLLHSTSRYINSENLMKNLFYIMIHRIIGFYNSSLKVDYHQVLQFYLYLFRKQFNILIQGRLEICLLYNILKIVVLQQKIDLSPIFKHYGQDILTPNSQEHILGVFCILNSLIVRRSQQTLLNQGMERDQFKTNLWNNLYIYCNVNFTAIMHKLDIVVKSIVSYRTSSLLSVICSRLNIRNLTRFFVEKMYDSPFNHDIQTIKLCIEMFNAAEFIKIDQLAKLVVSSPNSSKLVEREVLIAMCSIFKGIILENRQVGLAYAKLNHQDHLKNPQDRILLQETLLQHIGFAYYNLAKNEAYLEPKLSFNAKALQNFSRSFELNQQNYLLSYSLGKLYLQNYDYQNAYKYAVVACRNNKDNWQPFALLACIYMCQKKSHKSELIISQLLARHKKSAIIYYIKAYCEVNKLLQDVNNNEEVEASKFLGSAYYQSYKQKVLRSKDIKEILMLLETYFRLLGFTSDPVFTEGFLNKVKLPQDSDETTELIYYKSLKYTFDLLYSIDQLILCDIISKKLITQPIKKEGDFRYYKGLIHEKKKQFQQAYEQYNSMILESPYHCGALIRLSLLQKDVNKSSQYIQLVSKFRDNQDYNFAKGMVLSRLEEYELAHSHFMKDSRICWVEMLPDFMYYY